MRNSIIKCMRHIYIGVRGIESVVDARFSVSVIESSSVGWWYKQTRRRDLEVCCYMIQPGKSAK